MNRQILKTNAAQVIEISFQSTVHYQNPFREVSLTVTFKSPDGKSITVPAFWAGTQIWRVRYSAMLVGMHDYLTHCNDASNVGLHAQQGQILIAAYEGNNPLYQHGAIKIAEDQRHFAYQDGTPFFWLGDTWWMALCDRLTWPHDFKTLVQNRKSKGFNVVQLVAGLYPDMAMFDDRGKSDSGFSWLADLSSINPVFFDEADQKIVHLVEEGFTPCIIGAWGYYISSLGLENMQLHWRYLMARWGAYPVVWVAAGEQTMPWYLESPEEKIKAQALQKKLWSHVLQEMHQLNGFKRLITTHPVTSARESVNNAALIDFEMQQTGHAESSLHHAQRATQGWLATPKMLVISAESRYEALEIKPTITAQNIREAFWAHTLNSGCAGHTYGANGIWQVNLAEKPFGNSPTGLNWGSLPWNEAMHLVGATQLGVAKNILMTLNWHQFEGLPLKPNLIQKLSKQSVLIKKVLARLKLHGKTPNPIAGCISQDRSTALFYTITEKSFFINLGEFNQPVFAHWIDPINAVTTAFSLKKSSLNKIYKVKPIHKNAAGDDDWLLLISTKEFVSF